MGLNQYASPDSPIDQTGTQRVGTPRAPVLMAPAVSSEGPMKRPNQRPIRVLTQKEKDELADRAMYTGSPEHKKTDWWGGLPETRDLGDGRIGRSNKQQTTECPLTTLRDQVRATTWVREAIKSGQYKYFEGNNSGFPNRVWYEAEGKTWEGYCINRTSGEYKGWPID